MADDKPTLADVIHATRQLEFDHKRKTESQKHRLLVKRGLASPLPLLDEANSGRGKTRGKPAAWRACEATHMHRSRK